MDDRARLMWVMRNRVRKRTELQAGTLVKHLIGEVWANDAQPAVQAAAAIGKIVDDEFREHCRVASRQAGCLVIHVDEPALVSAVQRRWATKLAQAAGSMGGRPSVQRIVFAYGTSGVGIRDVEDRPAGLPLYGSWDQQT